MPESEIPGITEEDLPELVVQSKIASAGSEELDAFVREVLGKPVDRPVS